MQIATNGRKAGLGALAACLLLVASNSVSAQTFDTPTDFILEGEGAIDSENADIPSTLNAGDFDTSILGPGGAALNEVVIAASGFFVGDSTLRHRYWTIVHDSSTDTRSLVQTAPSDILVTNPEDPFYIMPSSLQVLDLNGDQRDDIALMGADELSARGLGASGGLKFFSSGFGPARVFGIPSQAGPSFFATSLNILGEQTQGSILTVFGEFDPNLAAADFDGDGAVDLAFYDFDGSDQLAVSLQNNASLGTLPRTDSLLNVPAGLAGIDAALQLVAADIDGDGPIDLAITFSSPVVDGTGNTLLVFKGNGDGSFVPDPIATVPFPDGALFTTLAVGNFDGNDFLDFGVTTLTDMQTSDLTVVLCGPGGSCSATPLGLPSGGIMAMFQLVSADFDGDGFDDLANSFIEADEFTPNLPNGGVQVRLNQGDGSFPVAPSQTLAAGGSTLGRVAIPIATKEIDGCGGPDLAYSAFELIPSPTPVALGGQGTGGEAIFHASVAFNHNDDPVADAGTPVATDGGVRVGGDPTCSGELGEVLNIEWEVVSGSAEISDPTAANPIVNAETDSVLQVTCSDLCGAASSATITVEGGSFLISGTGCALGSAGGSGGLAWLLAFGGLLPLALRRLRS